jgi:hypothetical protein
VNRRPYFLQISFASALPVMPAGGSPPPMMIVFEEPFASCYTLDGYTQV